MKIVPVAAIVGILMGGVSSARAATPRGPAIGTHIPALSAPDQTGSLRTFESLRGRKGLVLVFFRSADW